MALVNWSMNSRLWHTWRYVLRTRHTYSISGHFCQIRHSHQLCHLLPGVAIVVLFKFSLSLWWIFARFAVFAIAGSVALGPSRSDTKHICTTRASRECGQILEKPRYTVFIKCRWPRVVWGLTIVRLQKEYSVFLPNIDRNIRTFNVSLKNNTSIR